MRIRELKFEDPEVKKLARETATVLTNLSLDNMKYVELTGETHPTPDTENFFRHALGKVPSFCLVQEGRVYVPRYGMTEQEIDIRSAVASEPFRIIVIH